MSTSEFAAGGNPVMIKCPIQGVVKIFLVTSFQGNRGKVWPDEPLGLYGNCRSQKSFVATCISFLRKMNIFSFFHECGTKEYCEFTDGH